MIHSMEIGPSNVSFSPYHYLFIYLTSRKHEGPHIIISDATEWQDEEGIMVGRFEHYEDSEAGENTKTFKTIDEALKYAKELSN